ncbi:MAG TPA: hypothetical protein VFC39_15610 [Acidobacteriaceae bacterium]|nr:hypothetical protein [Acidobacteriaceae bacterium]
MATLAQPHLAERTSEEEVDALVDAMFNLTEEQLAMMTPGKRAEVIASIHATADAIPSR